MSLKKRDEFLTLEEYRKYIETFDFQSTYLVYGKSKEQLQYDLLLSDLAVEQLDAAEKLFQEIYAPKNYEYVPAILFSILDELLY